MQPSPPGQQLNQQVMQQQVPQQIMMVPVAMPPHFLNQPHQQVMYVVPSPLPMMTPPPMVSTPQTTPFGVLPSQSPSQPVPKPSFQRQRSAPNLRSINSPPSDRTPHKSPFVQQPVSTSPLANTASLLEKLHKSPQERGTEVHARIHIDPLDGTWGANDGTMMTDGGTLNSLEDLLDPKDIAALVMQQDSDPAATAMVEELKNELTDAAVRTKILRLEEDLCVNMVCVLEKQPQLMMDLCLKERGKILAHLVERLESDQSFPLVKFTLDNFTALALSQSGCIALPRILSCITESQRDVFFDEAKKNLGPLTIHPFGNYIVKHFVQLREKKYNADICTFLCSADALRIVSTNKFGSHVLEDVMRHSTPADLRPFMEHTFTNIDLLKHMCNDQFANYCIQSMFQFMDQCDRDPAFHSFCLRQVNVASQGSKYQKNILKHAVTALKPPQAKTRGKKQGGGGGGGRQAKTKPKVDCS